MLAVSNIPARMLFAAIILTSLAVLLTIVLTRLGLRRLLNVPRIPRPPAMFVVLGALWVGAVIGTAATVATAMMLRDHVRVAGPTRLADVRCEQVGPGRTRLVVRLPATGSTEAYDGEGNVCSVAVRQVTLRAPLRALDVPAVARLERVGAAQRDGSGPNWLDPGTWSGRSLFRALALDARLVPLSVPPQPGAEFSILLRPDGLPALAASQT